MEARRSSSLSVRPFLSHSRFSPTPHRLASPRLRRPRQRQRGRTKATLFTSANTPPPPFAPSTSACGRGKGSPPPLMEMYGHEGSLCEPFRRPRLPESRLPRRELSLGSCIGQDILRERTEGIRGRPERGERSMGEGRPPLHLARGAPGELAAMPSGRRQEASPLALRHPGRREHAAQALRRYSLLIQFSASPQGREGGGVMHPPGGTETALGTEDAASASASGHEPSCCQPPRPAPCRRQLLQEVTGGQPPGVALGPVHQEKSTPPADPRTAARPAAPHRLPSAPPPRHIKTTKAGERC